MYEKKNKSYPSALSSESSTYLPIVPHTHCEEWGYTLIWNNGRDTFAHTMPNVCYDNEVKTTLQLLEGKNCYRIYDCTDDNARTDIKEMTSFV